MQGNRTIKGILGSLLAVGIVVGIMLTLVGPGIVTAEPTAADFSANILGGQIVNGDFETGTLDNWTASMVAPYGDTPGVQLVTTGNYRKGTTGIRIWRTPVGGGNTWIEQQNVDLTGVECVRFWRLQYGVASTQQLSVLVDNTTVAVYNESTTTNKYTTIDLSPFSFSGTHTLRFDSYNGDATATFSTCLDDIQAFGPGTSGTVPVTFVFKDLSSNSPTSWAWDFNNDNVIDSTEQNPGYAYTTAGTYTVKLTATNANGSDEEVKTDYITVAPHVPQTWYADDSGEADFTTIQGAVVAAYSGDTVVVRDGTYAENIIIDNYVTPGTSTQGYYYRTGLIVRSENGAAAVTINVPGTNDIIKISAAGITVDGFTVNGNASFAKAGIYASTTNVGPFTIVNNIFYNVASGIAVTGVGSAGSAISNNAITLNGMMTTSQGKYTYGAGIWLKNTGNNTVANNTIGCNNPGAGNCVGLYLETTSTTSLCSNNTVSGNTITGVPNGIYVYGATTNEIRENTFANIGNFHIILTGQSPYLPQNNTFYLNSFVNFPAAINRGIGSDTLTNYWNSQTTKTYWFNGTQYTGLVGNYWSNYAGMDADGNGIGDTGYQTRTSPAEYDSYPLMGEWVGDIVTPVVPTAAFQANVASGTVPLTVQFTNQSTGIPTSWAWDFDNDGTVDSALQNPTYAYTTAGTYTVKLTATNAVGSDDEIKANYITVALPTYNIAASTGANGTIDPSGSVVVSEGGSQSFTITPATGYHVADVLVDSVSVGAVTSYTFTNVTAAHTIEASFAIDTFIIAASAGANGSIDPSGNVTVDYGASQSFTISASTGYHVADVLVDGTSVGAVASYEFTNVNANHTISVSFATDVPAWDLNGDSVCNIGDVVVIGLHWGETGTPGWIPQDLNNDGLINIGDVVVIGLHWGETW